MIDNLAHNWHLTEWDWLALIVAIISLIVASVSLKIAQNTLKSQRQTEKNTTPIMSLPIQEFLLEEVMLKLFDGYMCFNALSDILKKYQYDAYLSGDGIVDGILPIDNIHCELYYQEKDNYRCLLGLREMMSTYNRRIVSLNNDLRNPIVSRKVLEYQLASLLDCNAEIAKTWGMVMHILFDYTEKQRHDVFSKVIETVSIDDYPKGDTMMYDKNDCYVQSFSKEGEAQEKLIIFMSRYTASKAESYNDSMVSLKRNG